MNPIGHVGAVVVIAVAGIVWRREQVQLSVWGRVLRGAWQRLVGFPD